MYLNVFNEVIDIMHHDYAGCLDKKGWDKPDKYKEHLEELKRNGKLNDELFVEISARLLIRLQGYTYVLFKNK